MSVLLQATTHAADIAPELQPWSIGAEDRHREYQAVSHPLSLKDLSAKNKKPYNAIALVIELWLADKYSLTQSKYTEMTYREIVHSLRAYLQGRALDLDSETTELVPHIQLWASSRVSNSKRQGEVAPATYNQRMAAVSSFYTWIIMNEFYSGQNPVEQLTRATVHKYAGARVLNPQLVRTRLKEIDRSTSRGLRDYVLLQVALNTGQRLQSLASLTWGNVQLEGSTIILTFEQCKGRKSIEIALDAWLSHVFLAYLDSIYGESLDTLAPGMPIWVSFSDRTYGQAIGSQTIADICKLHLGVSSVHTLRHTFALTSEELGTQTDTIQKQLGHANTVATSSYLAKLRKGQNSRMMMQADIFGIEESCS